MLEGLSLDDAVTAEHIIVAEEKPVEDLDYVVWGSSVKKSKKSKIAGKRAMFEQEPPSESGWKY